MQRFARLVHVLGSALSVLAEILVALLALLFAFEVTMRYGFGRPTGFADQLGALMMPAITFLALARTYRDGQHVCVDLFVRQLPARAAAVLARFVELLTLGLSALLAWYAARLAWHSLVEGEQLMVGIWSVPLALPQVALPIGLAVLTLQVLVSLVAGAPEGALDPAREVQWSR